MEELFQKGTWFSCITANYSPTGKILRITPEKIFGKI
jgi:hypothetical protein